MRVYRLERSSIGHEMVATPRHGEWVTRCGYSCPSEHWVAERQVSCDRCLHMQRLERKTAEAKPA